MTKRNLVPQAVLHIPDDILAIFGDPPLLSNEDPKLYSDLLCRIAQAVDPKHMIEWIWIKDFVDITWEIQRLRHFRTMIIEEERNSRISAVKNWTYRPSPFEGVLGPEFEEKKPKRIQKKRSITGLKTKWGALTAFQATLETYDRIERLLASAELRRNALLRDIRYYREGLAHLLQEVSNDVIDGECSVSAE